MTSTGQDADNQEPTAENPYPGHCSEHAAAAAKYQWRTVRPVQEEGPVAHPGRVRPLPHQPRRRRRHRGRPARLHPRALAGGARALATFVIWKEDKSLIRTGNGPQVWSAATNLVITLFRIHGVTGLFTWLNTGHDFDESLARDRQRPEEHGHDSRERRTPALEGGKYGDSRP